MAGCKFDHGIKPMLSRLHRECDDTDDEERDFLKVLILVSKPTHLYFILLVGVNFSKFDHC